MNDYELQGFDRQVAEAAAALNQRPARGAYTEILLAYDGSADARAALERVAAVASDGSEVTVVTVIPYEAVGSKLDPIAPTDRDWQWRCLVDATAHLREYGIEPFIEAAAGNPAPVICETANSLKADLVILGYGHGGRRRPSVRKNPVRAAVEKTVECDTLVVRAEQSAHAPRVADAPEEERLSAASETRPELWHQPRQRLEPQPGSPGDRQTRLLATGVVVAGRPTVDRVAWGGGTAWAKCPQNLSPDFRRTQMTSWQTACSQALRAH